jgi:repressor LexA
MPTGTAEMMGPKIRRQRLRLALTQDELASRAGMSKPYLSLIETGRVANPPSDQKLRNLEQALGLSTGELVCLAYLQRTPLDVRAMLFGRPVAKPALEDEPAKVEEAAKAEEAEAELVAAHTAVLQPGVTLLDEPVGWPDITDRKAYAARVCDDSMAPAFRPGEIVVFSPLKRAAAGDDCFIRLTDGRTSFHRVFFETSDTGQPVVRLQPRNQRHRPTLVAADQVKSMHKAVFKYQRIERE